MSNFYNLSISNLKKGQIIVLLFLLFSSFSANSQCTTAQLTIKNIGPCDIELYHWLPSGDTLYAPSILSGTEITIDAPIDFPNWVAHGIGNNWQEFNAMFMLMGCEDQVWIINTDYCVSGCSMINPGMIESDVYSGCPGYTASLTEHQAPNYDNINNVTFEYQWYYSFDGVNYSPQSNSNSPNFTPGPVNQDIWFIRGVRIQGCNGVYLYSNPVHLAVTSCGSGCTNPAACNYDSTAATDDGSCVFNYTSGGQIGSNQTICSGAVPDLLTDVVSPYGGSGGTTEIVWISGPPGGPLALIPGANELTYQPGVLTQTTVFRRCTRKQECNDGGAGGFMESNSITITVDQNCTPTPVEDWIFNCGDGMEVELVGEDFSTGIPKTMNFSNPNNITNVVTEIVYKGANPGLAIDIYDDNGTAYQALRTEVGWGAYVYRASLPQTNYVTYNNTTAQWAAQSMVSYVFRYTGADVQSSGTYTESGGYSDIVTFNVAIPTDDAPRDMTIILPISEITDDGRYIHVQVTASDGTTQGITKAYPAGSSTLDMMEVNLTNVAGSANNVTVEVDTRNYVWMNVGGQSWVMGAAITAQIDCVDPCTTPVANNDSFEACPGNNLSGNLATNDSNLANATYTLVDGGTAAANGTLNLADDGSFTFDPTGNDCGNLSFTYEVCNDGVSSCTKSYYHGQNTSNGVTTDNIEVSINHETDVLTFSIDIYGNESTNLMVAINDGPNNNWPPPTFDFPEFHIQGNTVLLENYGGNSCQESFPASVVDHGNYFTYSFTADMTNYINCINLGHEIFDTNIGMWIHDVSNGGNTNIFDRMSEPTSDCSGTTDACCAQATVNINLDGGGNPPTANNLAPNITLNCGDALPVVTFSDNCSQTTTTYEELYASQACDIVMPVDGYYDWTNFWLHSFPAQYNKHFIWEDGHVVILDDGTVRIFGRVVNVDLPESGFYIDYYFEELVDQATFVANGGYNATDALADQRLYANVDFTKPNSIVGFGEFENSNLSIIGTGGEHFMDFGPRDVYGGNGVGMWIDYTGTVNGMPAGTALDPNGTNHNDMYAATAGCAEASGPCEVLKVRKWTVSDDCGNQQIFTQNVLAPGDCDFNLEIQGTDILCQGDCNGFAAAIPTGGSGPYSYLWSNGETNSTIGNLCPGNYSVTVTDNNGCVRQQNVTINSAPVCDCVPSTCTMDPGNYTMVNETDWNSGNWTFGDNWSVGGGCAPECGTLPNAFYDFSNATAYSSSLTSELFDQYCCMDQIYIDFCMRHDISGSIGVQNLFVQVQIDGGPWNTFISFQNSTSFYEETLTDVIVPGAAGHDFRIRFNATGEGGNDFAGGWGVDNVNLHGVSSGCSPVQCTANVGDYVWLDDNMNGIQDGNESGLAGVSVNLIAPGPDGLFHTFDDVTIATEVTDSNGYYLFQDVDPGQYCIEFVDTTIPAGYVFTSQDQGGDDQADSDVNSNGKTAVFNVVSGQDDDLSWDAGVAPCTVDIVISGPASQCAGEDAVFHVEPFVPGATYSWSYTGNPVLVDQAADGTSIVLNWPNVPGGYQVSAVVNYGLCADEYTFNITITDQVIADAGDDTEICEGGQIYLDGTNSSTYANYLWTVQNGDFTSIDAGATTGQPLVSPLTTTTYQLAVSDLVNNCVTVSFVTVVVDVNHNPTAIADVDSDVTCAGVDFTLDASQSLPPVADPTAQLQYVWLLNDSQVATGESYTTSSLVQATYELVAISMNTGCSDTTEITVSPISCTSIGNYVWNDLDEDGIQDANENGVGGVTVTLYDDNNNVVDTQVTDGNGFYLFENLLPGTYHISFTDIPVDFVFTSQNQGSDDALDSDVDASGNISSFTVTLGQPDDLTFDAGITTCSTPSIVGNEPEDVSASCSEGIPAVPQLQFTDNLDNNLTVVYDETFNDLACGSEILRTWTVTNFCGGTLVVDQLVSIYDDEAPVLSGIPADMNMECGDEVLDIVVTATDNCDTDLVVVLNTSTNVMACGYELIRTWSTQDDCGNTVSESQTISFGDTTSPEASNVPQDVTIDCNEALPTDEPTFTDICDSDLNITYDMVESFDVPSGIRTFIKTWTATDACGNETSVSQEISMQSCYINVGNYVWYDIDKDGIQDAGENPVSGVTVELINDQGDVVDTQTTDGNGLYLFENVPDGNYTIQFSDLPVDYVFTAQNQGGDDNIDSDPNASGVTAVFVVSSPGADDLTYDAGIYRPINIGDYVWNDVDQDGVQDPTEQGVGGVTVTLYDSNDNVIATTTTNPDGSYLFEDVDPGDYYLTFTDYPAGFEPTGQNQGGDDAQDSDVDATGTTAVFTLTPNQEDDLTFDAGLFDPVTIGNYVWYDVDKDGIQDASEQPVQGVTVELIDANNNVVDTQITDNNGLYLFEEVVPGDYTIHFSNLPNEYVFTTQDQGGDDATDSDVNNSGTILAITVSPSQADDLTYDAGIYRPINIGDYVWNDVDQDGIQDPTEQGIGGVTVTLYDTDDNVIATTTTNPDGSYLFEDVDPGDYYLVFSDYPAGFAPTGQDQGGNDAEDSDVNGAGVTAVFTLTPDQDDDLTFDAGLFDSVNIGNYVWYDVNQDGIQDANEDPIAGVTVQLIDENGVVVDTQVTNGDGLYLFEDVVPGDYTIQFSNLPTEYVFTSQDQGTDDALDSDANASGTTVTFTVSPSQADDLTFDAGIYRPINVGDYVWYDENQDGIQDPTEEGVEGVVVTLYDSNDNIIATTTTDQDGLYLFEDVDAGDYYVVFTNIPDGLVFTGNDNTNDNEDSDVDPSGTTPVFTVTYGQEDDLSIDAGLTVCSVPTLNEQEPQDLTEECSNPIPAIPTLTFSDMLDDNPVVVYSEETIDLDCGYQIVRTWEVTNYCENTFVVDQLVNIVDTTNPVLVDVPADVTVECGEDTSAPIVVATDNCQTTVPVEMTEVINDLDCGYEIVRTWTATDACGNSASDSQTITVIDTTPPVFTGTPDDITLTCGDPLPEQVVSVIDNCTATEDMVIVASIETINNDCGMEVIRTWTAIDECGNETSVSATATYVDTTPPVVISGPEDMTVSCNAPADVVDPVFEDACDDELEVIHEIAQDGPMCNLFITHTWTATDDCDNSTTYSMVIHVVDEEAPVLEVPANIEVDCGDGIDPGLTGTATATDNCVDPTITYVDGDPSGECPITIIRTWTAVDNCGNSVSADQTITIVDSTAPVLTLPDDITIECTESTDPVFTGEASATDDCNALEVTYTDEVTGECPYIMERTWIATDNCGNESTAVQTITIVDTVSPILSGQNTEITVECDENPEIPQPTASDNCDQDVQIVYSSELVEGDCPNSYTEIHTWIATDNCGNTDTRIFTVNYEDTTAPVLSANPADVMVECDAIPMADVVFATDNCDADVTVDFTESTGQMVGCTQLINRTWTATDDCGNEVAYTQTITVVDTTLPVLSGVPADATYECDEEIPDAVVTVTDNCDDDIIAILEIQTINNDCGQTIVRTWTAIDECGNETVATQTIDVVDTTAPVLEGVPADTTVECGSIPAAAVVTATDNCATPTVEFAEEMSAGCPYTITRTWTATDDCGNTSSAEQVITVIDDIAPVLIGVPADFEGQCGDMPAAPEVTATDNCDTNLQVTFQEVQVSDVCPLTIERTWSVSDACGNQTVATQTLIVNDTTAPEFTLVPEDVTVECDAVPVPGQVAATDNCTADVNIDFTESQTGECPVVITRTWTATDMCGNETEAVQVITVVDTTAPELVGLPQDDTVECDNVPDAPQVSAIDNCFTGELAVSFEETTVDLDCGYEIHRTWSATDNCGNTGTHTQILIVTDTTAPTVVSTPAEITVECDEELPSDEPVFTDNCDTNLTITSSDEQIGQTCGYYIIRTWTATDDCGNQTSTTRTINIIDETAPVLSAIPADVTVECDAIPAPATVTASDICDNNPTVEMEEISTGECPMTITRTWTATDICGNTVSASQVITVVDTTAPILVGVPADTSYECDQTIPDADVTATDNCDNDVSISFEESTQANNCNVTITRVWTATDNCGNSSSQTQVIVVTDSTAPVAISVPADVTIECGEALPTDQPVFEDNCDADVMFTMVDNVEDDGCTQVITRTWTAQDDCSNETSVSQIITITDTTSPTLIGVPVDQTVECTEIPEAPQVSGEDNCDSDVAVDFSEQIIDASCGYSIVRTWTATDNCGNTAQNFQTITVVDTTSPVVISSPQSITIECDQELPMDAPVFEDNCDNDLVISETEVQNDLDCGYEIVKTWTATDDCENSVSTSQTITILDTTSPTVVSVPANITIECDDNIPASEAMFSDNCDDELTVSVQDNVLPGSCPTIIERTWLATDDCGNSVSATQTITIVDTTAPVLQNIPADETVECDAIPAPASVSALDNCDDDVQVEFTEEMTSLDCGMIIYRSWTATDMCGNQSSATQTLTVVDTTAPQFENVPVDITVECSNIPAPTAMTATDNCDDDLEISLVENTVDNTDCTATLTRTWTVVDDCGNSTSVSQVITIVDTTAPVILSSPQDVQVECDNIPGLGTINAEDNCDEELEITTSESIEDLACGSIIIRTWVVTDDCGNTASVSQTITVVDTTAPELSGVPADISVECGDNIPEAVVPVVTDNCDAMPQYEVLETVNPLDCGYQLIRTYRAFDNCGNQTMQVQTITIEDTTAPQLQNVPADMTLNCQDLTIAPSVVAIDMCDDDVEVVLTEDISGDCPYTLTRTWTATDNCGNMSTATQVLTVIDEEAPVWNDFDLEVDVPYEDLNLVLITASDNCDDDVQVTWVDQIFSGGCYGTVFRTYTAEDNCGNSIEATQIIHLYDTTAPVIYNVPADVDIACGDDIPAVPTDVYTTDNAAVYGDDNNELTLTFTEVQTDDFCPYQIIRTWVAEDHCGNVTQQVQIINVTVDTPSQVDIVSYPNPFNDYFTVKFSVPENSVVDVCVLDMTGRQIEPIHKGSADAHRLYDYEVSSIDWEAGSYIIQMVVGDRVYYHRMVLMNN